MNVFTFSPRRNIFLVARGWNIPRVVNQGVFSPRRSCQSTRSCFLRGLQSSRPGGGGTGSLNPTSHPQLVPLWVAVSELYFKGHGPAFKTLAAAAAAGDALWAVVEGTAINQDGRTVTLTPRARPDPRWSSLPIQIIFFIIICFWYKLSEFPVCQNYCIGFIIFLTAFLITHNRVDEICRKMLRPPFLWFDKMG